MNYLKYFTSYFSSEKSYSPIKNNDERKIVKNVNYDEFDEQVINSVNKQMFYKDKKSNINLEKTRLLESSNKTNKIKFARKNSL